MYVCGCVWCSICRGLIPPSSAINQTNPKTRHNPKQPNSYVVSGAGDGFVKVWDPQAPSAEEHCLRTLQVRVGCFDGRIYVCICVCALGDFWPRDTTRINHQFTLPLNGSTTIYPPLQNKLKQGHHGSVLTLIAGDGVVISGSRDSTVKARWRCVAWHVCLFGWCVFCYWGLNREGCASLNVRVCA